MWFPALVCLILIAKLPQAKLVVLSYSICVHVSFCCTLPFKIGMFLYLKYICVY